MDSPTSHLTAATHTPSSRAVPPGPPGRWRIGALAALLLGGVAAAEQIIVDPVTGDDARDGSGQAQAVRTLARAKVLARSVLAGGGTPEVVLCGGTHVLGQTLEFTPEDAGGAVRTVRWRAKAGEYPVVSGGTRITGWAPVAGSPGLWSAPAPGHGFRQLWVQGRRAVRARWPDAGTIAIDRWDAARQVAVLLPVSGQAWPAGLVGGDLVTGNSFTSNRIRITSATTTAEGIEIGFSGTESLIWSLHGAYRGRGGWFENRPACIDQAGEWFLDGGAGTVFYRPLAGEDPTSIAFAAWAPRLETLIAVRGTGPTDRVQGLAFSGFACLHAGWTRPDTHGCIEYQAFRIFSDTQVGSQENNDAAPAAITVSWASGVTFQDMAVASVGANGFELALGTTGCSFTGGVVRDTSGNGIVIGRPTPDGAAWNGAWPGSPTWEPCTGDVISDTVIDEVGRDYRGSIGIFVGVTKDVQVTHNRVQRAPYSGISVGWGWTNVVRVQGGTAITGNQVRGVMSDRLLHDGGGIYVLAAQPGTTIADNHVILTHGKGALYFDEGSGPIPATGNALECSDAMVHASARTFGDSVSGGWSTSGLVTSSDGVVPPTVLGVTVDAAANWPAAARTAMQAAGPRSVPVWLDRISRGAGPQVCDALDGWVDTIGTRWVVERSPASLGGSEIITDRPGDAAVVCFRGTRIRWYGSSTRGGGRADVTIDWGAPSLVETYRPGDDRTPVLLYDSGDLALGDHELRLTVRADRHPDSASTNVAIDSVIINGPAANQAPAISSPSVALPGSPALP
jgi:hypothetical protein